MKLSQSRTTDVLVIGGGATGTGVLRDLAMRGLRAILVERYDLADGTTGRYHGLLHSGARYVERDAEAARDCARENAVLRRIIPHCIEDTGGLFVSTPWDPKRYAEEFVAICYAAGVPARQLSLRQLRRREPLLHPHISHAFEVADAAADSFLTVEANIRSACEYGAEVLTYHRVVDLLVAGGRVLGAIVEHEPSGERVRIDCAYVINAAGAWAGQIGRMAGVPIDIVAGKGVMIALNHRLVNMVVNRCKPPGDGDILVPIRTVCVAGTTDEAVPNPDDRSITRAEIDLILEEGERMLPGLSQARLLRAWAGVRPLYREKATVADRELSRDFKVLDHATRDGVEGLISVVGGKYTTYRLMAERTVDLVAQRLGITTPCQTANEIIPPPPKRSLFVQGLPLAQIESVQAFGSLICECELVTRAQVEAAWRAGATSIDDVRRDTRVGMGPCQGGFCTYRAAALQHEAGTPDAETSVQGVRRFVQERWRGVAPVLWGDQLRQARLDEHIFLGLLNMEADHVRTLFDHDQSSTVGTTLSSDADGKL